MTAQEKTAAREKMIRTYDRTMVRGWVRNYYEDSGFFNFGYWRAASRRSDRPATLVDRLLERIPRHGEYPTLPAAWCPTRHLAIYPPNMITAINVSSAQTPQARSRPAAAFADGRNATRFSTTPTSVRDLRRGRFI
jgi:hypothetical protein